MGVALIAILLVRVSEGGSATPRRLVFQPAGFKAPGLNDHLAGEDGVVKALGYTVTVNGFNRAGTSEGTQLCATVTYLNSSSTDLRYDYLLDWVLQLPSGTTAMPNPDGYIRSGTLGAGASVTGSLCFAGGHGKGSYTLVWRPVVLGHDDRGLWSYQSA
jgi:hypothetical protein